MIPVLNKTYTDSGTTSVAVNTTTVDVFDSKEFTIQAGKAFTLTIQVPVFAVTFSSANWSGFYFGTSIKVNGTWYDMGNSGYSTGMTFNTRRPDRYYDTKYIDLIGDNIVVAGDEYKIFIKIRSRTYSGTGIINAPDVFTNQAIDSGNRGEIIAAVADQNFTTVIIQERDR